MKKLIFYIICMGNIFNPLKEENWEEVKCKCKLNLAKYRFEVRSKQICSDYDLDKIYTKFPDLEKYYFGSVDYDSGFQFIACDYCINEKYKKFFVEMPNGWKEHIKCKVKWNETISIDDFLKD